MNKFFLLFLLVLLCSKTLCSGTPCKIAFRLDDIQDYFCADAQVAVISYFLQNNIPLSIGIISNYFGTDSTVVNFVQTVSTNGSRIEIASHGVNHESFPSFTYDEQVNLLNTSRNQIQAALPGIPPLVTFITPYDVFNSDTLLAMGVTGYSYLSAGIGVDPCPLSNLAPVYHYPRGAATATEDANMTPVPADITISQIETQLSECGFSVVMLHPKDFSLYSDGSGVNTTQLAELGKVFTYATTTGCTLGLLREMNGGSTTVTATQPLTTQPLTTQPLTTQPLTTQPLTTQPLTTQPLTTQPLTTQPLTTQPLTTQPLTTQPLTTQPLTTQPLTTQPLTTQPLTTQPVMSTTLSPTTMFTFPHIPTIIIDTHMVTVSPPPKHNVTRSLSSQITPSILILIVLFFSYNLI